MRTIGFDRAIRSEELAVNGELVALHYPTLCSTALVDLVEGGGHNAAWRH